MEFTLALPETKPWLEMSDTEREAYFVHCRAHQPLDRSAFNDALKAKRQALEIPRIAEPRSHAQEVTTGLTARPI